MPEALGHLSDYVLALPDALTPDLCRQLVDRFDAEPLSRLEMKTAEGGYRFAQLQVSKHWRDVHEALVPIFRQAGGLYADHVVPAGSWPTPQRTGMEAFRLKRYLPNGEDGFPPHVDVGDYASARRFLVMFLYLNTVEEGGETSFPGILAEPIRATAGTLLMFPPLWPWLHAGEQPRSGPKYLLGSYLHYL
jgi:hypothetical protein